MKAPLAWLALLGLWLLSTIFLLIIPVVGQIAANVLQPVFFAGIMLACRAQEAGEVPTMNAIFSGFRENARALIIAGCIIFFIEIVVIMLVRLLGLPDITMTADGKSLDFAAFQTAMDGKEWIAFLFFFLVATVKGVFWFVPPLLAFHKMSAGAAIRWSLYAFLSNMGAILLYGLVAVLLLAAVILTFGAMMVFALPLMAISNYTGYKAMFEEGPSQTADPRTGIEA